jgi:hypothetical protein
MNKNRCISESGFQKRSKARPLIFKRLIEMIVGGGTI